MPAARSRALGWGLGAAAVVAALSLWAWPFTIDDAFIPCRYAANFAGGRGLVWNPGETAAGVTGIAWTLLLTAARLAGVRDLPAVAKLLGLVCALAAATWVVARTRLGAGGRRGGALAALGLVTGSLSLAVYAVAGLETAAFTLAVTAAGLLPARGRWGAAGLSAGLATVVRPEGAAVVLVVAAIAALDRRPRAAARVLACAAPFVLVAAAVSLWAFGSVVPDTLAARRAPAGAGLAYLAGALVPTGALLAWPLALLGGATSRTRRAALAIVATLVVAVAVLGGDWMPGWRFLVPIWPLTGWLAVRGALVLRVRVRRRAGALLAGALLIGAVGLGALTTAVTMPDVRAAGLERARAAPRLVRALERLHVRHVALVDVGYVGWATRFETTDLAGLTDRRIAQAPGPYLDKRIDEAYLLERDPDAIVVHVEGPHGAGMFPVERRVASYPQVAARWIPVTTVQRTRHYRYIVLGRRTD